MMDVEHEDFDLMEDEDEDVYEALQDLGRTRTSLPRLIGNDLHFDVMEDEDEDVFEEAGAIMKQHPEKIQLYLHVDQDFQHLGEALKDMIFKCLPRIKRIRLHRPINNFVLQLFLQAAQNEVQTGQKTVMLLADVIDFNTIFDEKTSQRHVEFLLDLFSHIKVFETERGQSVQPLLNPVYQSAPAVWDIDLSNRKASILLEVLKFQTDKKPVNIISWSDEENELWSFLQCLPYISQLGLGNWHLKSKEAIRFIANLFIQAAECDRETGEKKLQLLSSVCSYSSFPTLDYRFFFFKKQSDFLLDLYSLLTDCENPSRKHVLQALQPVYQSAPADWVIDLSKRKASILLGVLELQTVKKPVKLVGWSDEETEIKSFLQCLPYISQLGLGKWHFISKEAIRFIANLFIQAAECDRETGEKKLQLLSSVCSYFSFPALDDKTLSLKEQSDFLLDLYSFFTACENPSHKHVLQALQPVYQSAPAGWVIDLSKRKTSILLGVLEFQTVKKPVELVGWSVEENEQRSILQFLPYVSELDVSKPLLQQLLCLISVGDEVQVTRQAAILSRVLGRKVDLSHIQIDPQTCVSLAAVLEQAERLSELDLSHCQLNDHSVDLLLPHLHKARVLDLSNNEISDLGALRIHSVVSTSSYIQTVRLINNRITDTATFLTDPRYDLWDQSKDQITVEFRPDLNHHNDELSYSFSCESGGQFQCSETGLVFLMKAAGKVEYSPAYWDEAALKTAGYEPAGPLFNIEDPERGLCSLQLPHCEADVEGREHLSVAHFCGGNMEVLKPLAVTDTHVMIHVQNLSFYGLLRNIFSLITPSVRGQVLLFHPPGSPPQKQVYMFLLPSNVPVSQVKHQHLKCRYITTTADCMFIANQKYSVTSDLKGVHEIQPESWVFFCNYGPNFHPTFEVFFNHDITEMRLAILDDRQHEVWVRRISLTAEAAPDSNQAGDAEVCGALEREVNPGEVGEMGGASGYMKDGQHFVDRNMTALISRVSAVALILDQLYERRFMQHEMYMEICDEKTSFKQMRMLMQKVIMPGNNRVKDELCRILEKEQKYLMQELKGQ
uniref:FIIND domain-containing protein n=1 Tax=Paramormyrops kingsleyae TaxID=1676925 RepID=A0A3B3SU61_9TELE